MAFDNKALVVEKDEKIYMPLEYQPDPASYAP